MALCCIAHFTINVCNSASAVLDDTEGLDHQGLKMTMSIAKK
jgi:hypothetical protein